MDIIINVSSASYLKKYLFNLKPTRKDGLLLQIHHTITAKDKPRCIRFICCCFNNTGQILVAATLNGDIYVIDFTQCKFWSLMNVTACSVLTFSSQDVNCIIAGITSGALHIINIHTGDIIGSLIGHSFPVNNISFSNDFLCVSSSNNEAIVWDLRNNSKVQVLSLSSSTFLKQMLFMPVSNNILACFNDDSINVWKFGSFDYLKRITPANWNKFHIRNITFTKNGRIMALAGNSSNIPIFSLDSWNLEKTIFLPEQTKSVKKLMFISQPFDGGASRVLSLLSSNGIIYFYDVHTNTLLNKLKLELEILKYDVSSDGKYLACIITCGRINLYLLAQYISIIPDTIGNVQVKSESKHKLCFKKNLLFVNSIKEKIDDILNSQKLNTLLKEFGEYPEAHRLKIWSQLLHLPNNQDLYNTLINFNSDITTFDFDEKYPLENKVALKNLKKLIVNLVNWCPFFGEVDYLPVFAFPFVKVFKNDPIRCFEAVCTIIVNWCQYWFEYYPLPPINILAIIENILLEHSPYLLNHFTNHNITSKLYAWPIIQTVFSEILTDKDWLILWDHVLSNEPSYLIFAVVAFNLLNFSNILRISDPREIEQFYHNQHMIDIKKFIGKTYYLLHNTSEKNHPRQYLNFFTPIEVGKYPEFSTYPRPMSTLYNKFRDLRNSKYELKRKEQDILLSRDQLNRFEEIKRDIEENTRLKELDDIYRTKLEDEIAIVDQQQQRLDELKISIERQEVTLQQVIPKSSNGVKEETCYCANNKRTCSKCCNQTRIATDLNATNKLIKKVENKLRRQSMDSLQSVEVQELATEIAELEIKVLSELQLLEFLKETPNNVFQQDFAFLKYTMKKIEDGYEARNTSPIP